jgi:hypothetical protein
MVNHPAVGFFRNPIIVAPIPCFKMINRNPQPAGYKRAETAIRVSQDEKTVRLMLQEKRLASRDYLAYLISKTITCYSKANIRLSNAQFAKENIVQSIVVVLPSMNQDVLGIAIKQLDH